MPIHFHAYGYGLGNWHLYVHPPSPSKFTPFCFGGFSSYEDILHFTTRCGLFREQIWVIIESEVRNYDHHRWEINKQMKETNTPRVPFDKFLIYHWERCGKVDHVRHRGFERICRQSILSPSIFCRSLSALRSFAGVFRHCRPLAASQVIRNKDIQVIHKFVQA